MLSPLFADDLTEKQLHLQRIYRELKDQKEKVRRVKVQERGALARLFVVRAELDQTRNHLEQSKRQLFVTERRLDRVSGQLQVAQRVYGEQTKRFLLRLGEFYKSGQMNYLDLILGAKDISDFTNRSYYFGRIIDYDATLVGELKKQRNFIQNKREEIVNLTGHIRDLTGVIADREKQVSQQARERNQIYQGLRAEREEYERQLAEKRASSKQLETLIESIFSRTQGKVTAKVTGRFRWPLSGSITSYFGYRSHPLWGGSDFHTGIDIVSPYGKPIQAADGGEVILSGWWDGYGKCVVIDHGKGKSTVYGHMSRIFLNKGQKVTSGETIGLVGSTGYSTGPHLHFEVRISGKPQNPLAYLP